MTVELFNQGFGEIIGQLKPCLLRITASRTGAEEDHQILNELPSFNHFHEQLKSNGFEVPSKQEWLTLIASSVNIFNS